MHHLKSMSRIDMMNKLESIQLANTVLMVRPAHFGFNAETGSTNVFQHRPQEKEEQVSAAAMKEFDSMTEALRTKGIIVIVVEDSQEIVCPDAVFPNNWITTHHDGTIITYPMQTPSRRLERRDEILDLLTTQFEVKRKFNLELFEEHNQFLEGTGSMIFDHDHRIVYAGLSPRTNVQLLSHFGALMKYEVVFFNSNDEQGVPVYHTNVMMAMGLGFVVICMESVDLISQKLLRQNFEKTGKEVVEISFGQMNHFAGNMLQLRTVGGRPVLVMSQTAYDSLDAQQFAKLRRYTDLLPVEIPTIEKVGGGSARCMMAEIFLQPRKT